MRPTAWLSALLSLWNRVRPATAQQLERDIADELEHHRSLLARDLAAGGHANPERAAAIRLGNTRRLAEESSDAWQFRWWSDLGRDMRFAIRQLRRAPVVAAAAILSLALGVGLNASMFSMLHDALLRRLPVQDVESLRVVGEPADDGTWSTFFPWPMVEVLQREARTLRQVAAIGDVRFLSIEEGGARQLTPNGGAMVSANYFELLGVRPHLGRMLLPADDAPAEGARVAVLSHALWQSRFGGDPTVVNRVVRFNGHGFSVVGVAPPAFTGTTAGRTPDAWFPITTDHLLLHRTTRWRAERTNWWVQAIGRVEPGITEAAVTAELTALHRRFRLELEGSAVSPETRREIAQLTLSVRSGASGMPLLADNYGQPIRLLFLLSAAVLLLACANVISLLVGRLHTRHRELSVRLALGASTGRLAGHLLVEGLVLAVAGAGLGIGVFAMFGGVGRAYLLPLAARLSFPDLWNPATMAFAAATLLLVACLVAGVPALLLRSRRVADLLGSRGAMGGRESRAGRWLSAVQFALACPLVVTSLLLAQSLAQLRALPTGFDPGPVMSIRVDGTRNGYGASRRVGTYRQIVDALGAVPGVRSASAAMFAPMSGSSSRNTFRFEGVTDTPSGAHAVMYVDPGYFRTLGVTLTGGREFDRRDDPRERGVAVISAGLADKLYGQSPAAIGRRMARSQDPAVPMDIEIVGVAPDARLLNLRDDTPETVYQPFLADSNNVTGATLLVATTRPAELMEIPLRRAVALVDPALEILDVRPLQRNFDGMLVLERTVARLTLLFGFVALLLAALGLYATCNHAVTHRVPELGVRLALGASPHTLRRGVVRQAIGVLAIGAVAGVPLAWGAARASRALLFGLTPGDPQTLLGVAALLAGAAILAAWIPARRAASVDPLTSLRA